MEKGIKILDIPEEVREAWVIANLARTVGIGMELMNKYDAIVDKYPKWFEWEHKMKAVPQEVHDAYNEEAFGEARRETIKLLEDFTPNTGAGIWNEIQAKIKEEETNPEQDLHTILKSMDDAAAKRRQEQQDERKRLRKIWDKHYSKYNIEFRE